MRNIIVALGMATALGGCATHISDEVVRSASREVTCAAGPDCDAKWSRAVTWIVKNSRWKIQTQTDLLIQTFNPSDSSAEAAFTVTKTALGGGRFLIDITPSCANLFGCIPDVTTSVASFKEFVSPEAAPAEAKSPAAAI